MHSDKFWLTGLAIVTIGLLELVALMLGIDGAVFGIALAAIAGLAGYRIKAPSK